jgi:hypothetical protein
MDATHPAVYSLGNDTQGVLLMSDGSSYKGTSFGAQVSVAGETVFQTGIVELINRNGWVPRIFN